VADRVVPSLAMAAALAAARAPLSDAAATHDGVRVGAVEAPLVRESLPRFATADDGAGAGAIDAEAWRLLVDYRGPAVLPDGRSTSYRQVSFYDVFYSREQEIAGEAPLLDPTSFKDAIVVVGTSAAGLFDVFATPFGNNGAMPGAVLHANVIDSLLSGRFLQQVSAWWSLAITALAALGACVALLGLGRRSMVAAVVAVLAGTAGIVAASAWAFGRGVWIPLVEPIVAVGFVFGGGYFLESREKRVVKQLFSRYLSRDVYQRLLANPAAAELGGARRDMTVLFSDVRGFTAMSEQGAPEDVVAQLNEYFSAMVDLVFANRGTVDKFVGDMVMALFGAPLDDDRHADRAVQTALAMVEALERLNDRWRAAGRPTLAIGIGINSGEMIAGNIGSERIRSYTVIGDAVNLGSRLESLNKEKGTSIIISEATANRLLERYDLRSLGSVVVRGRQQAVTIFEVRPPAPSGSAATAASERSGEGTST
jgi:adenylate cyclase